MENQIEKFKFGDDKDKKIPDLKDLELWMPTKPVTMKEVLEEMKKQGRRALTIEELEAIIGKDTKNELPKLDNHIIEGEYKEEK